jgi:uncharacterized surface protein with fasciclin (FAS1) repeats
MTQVVNKLARRLGLFSLLLVSVVAMVGSPLWANDTPPEDILKQRSLQAPHAPLGASAVKVTPAQPAVSPSANQANTQANTIVDALRAQGHFTTLLTALDKAGLLPALSNPEKPVTLFAPTDEAFAKMPKGAIPYLLLPEQKEKLTHILLYHVVDGAQPSTKVVAVASLASLYGNKPLLVETRETGAYVGGAKVIMADKQTTSGVVHAVDKVIIPQ